MHINIIMHDLPVFHPWKKSAQEHIIGHLNGRGTEHAEWL